MKVRCTACQSHLVRETKGRYYCSNKWTCPALVAMQIALSPNDWTPSLYELPFETNGQWHAIVSSIQYTTLLSTTRISTWNTDLRGTKHLYISGKNTEIVRIPRVNLPFDRSFNEHFEALKVRLEKLALLQ